MRVPTEIEFPTDFLQDNDLKALGDRIIREKLPDLDDGELIIDYAWKKKGGASGGAAVLGKCVKLSGHARYYALGAHFLIWLGANWVRGYKFDDRQIEALVYHELLHIEREEPEEEDKPVVYRTRAHDAEFFLDELRLYGAWKSDLVAVVETVRQLALPGLEPALVGT